MRADGSRASRSSGNYPERDGHDDQMMTEVL